MSDKGGRPGLYTPELGTIICERMANGESLRKICRDDSMPCMRTVLMWAREIPEFLAQYVTARELLLEHWAEDITEISDDGTNDWMSVNDPDNPGYRVNGEHVSRSKLRVDSRKWLLSKLAAKKYGDRVSAELSGPDGGPIQTKDMTEDDLAREIAFVLSSAMQAQEKTH